MGLFSIPFVLVTITIIIVYGGIPSIFMPLMGDVAAFIIMITSIIISLLIHELSHIIVLINHGVSNISLCVSMRGAWGWLVKADVDPKMCNELILPFYSIGLGANLLLFLIFLIFYNLNPYLHIISVVNFWILLINGIPAPIIDGGRLFEVLLIKLRIEKHIENISIFILVVWLLLFIIRIFIL
ncbi:MAG: hypothetical protein NZ922_05800 [Candidatus Methanomethyliaceae archaeon]|nr:hypothetical protein [Candidatus Methanomethyliaceae archaeon]MDW7970882.1 hypothetical protein [Nitrososphaerota archaeon]